MVIYRDVYYPPADDTRRLHIYLPRNYELSDERYPVMYMFDGHNLYSDAHATYGKSWGLEAFLNAYEKPLIVVGMECSHEGHGRLDEYGPYETTILGHRIHPMGHETFRWIVDDVKPLVDARLRTWPHREATGIGGSSMGGIMSLYGAIVFNEVFGKAACLAAGVHRYERRLMEDLAKHAMDPDTRIYLSFGEDEKGRMRAGGDPATDSAEAKACARLMTALDALGVASLTYYQKGGRHNEASWEMQNHRYLDFLWRS